MKTLSSFVIEKRRLGDIWDGIDVRDDREGRNIVRGVWLLYYALLER